MPDDTTQQAEWPEYPDTSIDGLDPADAVLDNPDPTTDVDHEPNPDAGDYSSDDAGGAS